MGLTVINNTDNLRIVHNTYDAAPRRTLHVVHKKINKPVIQLLAH